jgi:hypothetical protein
MTTYIIECSINDGEYTEYVYITCYTLVQLSDNRVKADHVVIRLGNPISAIRDRE